VTSGPLTDAEWAWLRLVRLMVNRGVPLNAAEEQRLAAILPRIRIPRPRPPHPGVPPPTVPIAQPPPLSQTLAGSTAQNSAA
jgi:hypothetical protein